MRRRNLAIVLLVAVLATSTAGCIRAKAGAKCRTTDWGQSDTHALRCVNGRWRNVMTRQQAIAALVAIAQASQRPAVGQVVPPATLGTPSIPNLADPAVFVEGGTTYVYGTINYRTVPVVTLANPDATAPAFAATDAMPTKPPWASTTEIWAPTVASIGGRYVMFFAAHRPGVADPNSAQCVGRAVATSPLGPFAPDPYPVHCGIDGKGALDPDVFIGPDGRATLLLTMGGSSTNLYSIPLDANADPAGAPVALLKREQPWQDWFLENPSMYFDGSVYLLAYSAGRWDTANYMTGVARCASPAGPCTDQPSGPWLSSIGDRVGPGGLDFFVGPDGAPRVAFHTYPANNLASTGARATHIRRFVTDPWPRLV